MKPGSNRERESRDIPSVWWDLRFDQYKIKHTPKTKKAPQGSRRFFRREGISLPAANLSSLAPQWVKRLRADIFDRSVQYRPLVRRCCNHDQALHFAPAEILFHVGGQYNCPHSPARC